MEVRGRRECKDCGTRWSYFETGTVACPDCGSPYSVGVDDERTLHTASPATLDLTPVRGALDEEPLRRIAARAAERCRAFTRGYGFVGAGDLQSLDDVYLTAVELEHVGTEFARRMDVSDDEERYLLALLRADEGDRVEPTDVPTSSRGMRGLACADAVETYRSDVRRYLDAGDEADPTVVRLLERLSQHVRRVRALDGDVPPREAERLVGAARDVGRAVTGDDEGALGDAETRLDALE